MSNHLQKSLSASEGQLQIYVVCLSSYNNGILFGEWIDATCNVEDIQEQHIKRDESIEKVQEKALFIVEHGDLGAEVLAYHHGNLYYATEALEEYYVGEYESELDYAAYLFDELYLHEIPKSVCDYISYTRFQRDIFIDDYFSLEVNGSCHIFRCS